MDVSIALVMWSHDLFQICDLGFVYVHVGRESIVYGVSRVESILLSITQSKILAY